MSNRSVVLCIQIPCFNEAESLSATLRGLPRKIHGVDRIEILVIDDGSSDQSVRVAQESGAKVLRLKSHKGLARAFSEGLSYSLSLGADVIVNFDADNQYSAGAIEDLIKPILHGNADVVLGARDFVHQGAWRKFLQRLGSWFISCLVRLKIPDAATGFRAFSAEAARRIHVFTRYTYTIETLIQAGYNGDKVVSIPVKTNRTLRPSRLFKSPWTYLLKNLGAVIRLTFLYNPLRMMGGIAITFGTIAVIVLSANRPLYGLIFAAAAFFTLVAGLLLDQVSVNRRVLERVLFELNQAKRDDSRGTTRGAGKNGILP